MNMMSYIGNVTNIYDITYSKCLYQTEYCLKHVSTLLSVSNPCALCSS